jgi:hypothetical protein
MPKRQDPTEAAHRVVSEVIARHEKPLPADVEAAWQELVKRCSKGGFSNAGAIARGV